MLLLDMSSCLGCQIAALALIQLLHLLLAELLHRLKADQSLILGQTFLAHSQRHKLPPVLVLALHLHSLAQHLETWSLLVSVLAHH
jgi:hypothetical protein